MMRLLLKLGDGGWWCSRNIDWRRDNGSGYSVVGAATEAVADEMVAAAALADQLMAVAAAAAFHVSKNI